MLRAEQQKNTNKDTKAHTICAIDIGNAAHFPPKKNSKPDNLRLSKKQLYLNQVFIDVIASSLTDK